MIEMERDKEGYLLDFAKWNKDIAKQIALEENITLTDEHWLVINFLRNFYATLNQSPAVRPLVNALKKEYGSEKGNSIYLQSLFPVSPAKQATKIAGLPKPVRCI